MGKLRELIPDSSYHDADGLIRLGLEFQRFGAQAVGLRGPTLFEMQSELLLHLAVAAEFRDDNTGRHTQRVGWLAGELARTIGLPQDSVELIREAAPLHDIGKIGIPDHLLLKPGKLTPEEYDYVKLHTKIGGAILAGSKFPVLRLAEKIALYHHERWDGGGYCGLGGEDIPLEARIVTLADTFDVITHDRPYKKAASEEYALSVLVSEKGRQMDSRLVDAFVGMHGGGDLARLHQALTRDTPASRMPTGLVQRGQHVA